MRTAARMLDGCTLGAAYTRSCNQDHVPRIRLRHRPRRQCHRRPCRDLDVDLYADSRNMHRRGSPPMLLASAISAVDVLAAATLASPSQSAGLPSPRVAHLPLAQLPLVARPLQ